MPSWICVDFFPTARFCRAIPEFGWEVNRWRMEPATHMPNQACTLSRHLFNFNRDRGSLRECGVKGAGAHHSPLQRRRSSALVTPKKSVTSKPSSFLRGQAPFTRLISVAGIAVDSLDKPLRPLTVDRGRSGHSPNLPTSTTYLWLELLHNTRTHHTITAPRGAQWAV